MATPTTTATGQPPPSSVAPAATAVKPDPKGRPDNMTGHYVFAVVCLFGFFALTALALWAGPDPDDPDRLAELAAAAVMFFYCTAVSLLLLRYWDKKRRNELPQGSGCRLMVCLSLVTGMMFISLVLTLLLLRPDWRKIAFIMGVFLCGTVWILGFIYEEDQKALAREMNHRASCPQEKTSDQV